MKKQNHCTGCADPDHWDLPEGRTHQMGTVEHPEKQEESPKCCCGEVICIGMAEVEIGGICHRPNNPCYVIEAKKQEEQDIIKDITKTKQDLIALTGWTFYLLVIVPVEWVKRIFKICQNNYH